MRTRRLTIATLLMHMIPCGVELEEPIQYPITLRPEICSTAMPSIDHWYYPLLAVLMFDLPTRPGRLQHSIHTLVYAGKNHQGKHVPKDILQPKTLISTFSPPLNPIGAQAIRNPKARKQEVYACEHSRDSTPSAFPRFHEVDAYWWNSIYFSTFIGD